MGDIKEIKIGNPILKASPESKALVKRLIDGMSPENKASLVAELQKNAEELKKQREPAIREQMAENHRQQVRKINRQTMIEQARYQTAEIKRSDMH